MSLLSDNLILWFVALSTHRVGGLELVKPARKLVSSRPKPCVSLKNAPEILPLFRSLLALVGRNPTVVGDHLSPKQILVCDFDSLTQGFGTPLGCQRSSCSPASPNLVPLTLPGVLRQCHLPLAYQLLKGPKLQLRRGTSDGHQSSTNQTAAASQPTG